MEFNILKIRETFLKVEKVLSGHQCIQSARQNCTPHPCHFGVLALCLIPSLASAQTVNQFTTSIAGDIVDSPNCTTTVTRTFSVATSFSVKDVDFGVLLTHKYRSDLRITLTSPAGTTVQLMNAIGGGENNLNVLFDDEAAVAISSHTSTMGPNSGFALIFNAAVN